MPELSLGGLTLTLTSLMRCQSLRRQAGSSEETPSSSRLWLTDMAVRASH